MTILFKSISDVFSLDDVELKDKSDLSDILEVFKTDKYWVNGDGIFFNKNYTSEELYKILFYISSVFRFELDQNTSHISFIVSDKLGKYFRSIDFIEDVGRKDNDVLFIGRDEFRNLYGEIKGDFFGADDTFRKPRCPYCGGERLSDIFYTDPFKNDHSLLSPGSKVEVRCYDCKKISILEGYRAMDFYE